MADPSKQIRGLEEQKTSQLALVTRCLDGSNKNFYLEDILVIAALNRSVSNIDSFIHSAIQKNYLTLGSLVRLQLDSVLRLSALWLVADRHDFTRRVIKGEEIRKIKDRDNQQLTDRYLCNLLSRAHNAQWIVQVYKQTSGFIHLSEKHLLTIFSKIDTENLSAEICVNGKGVVDESYIQQGALYMLRITEILAYYVEGWIATKDASAASV